LHTIVGASGKELTCRLHDQKEKHLPLPVSGIKRAWQIQWLLVLSEYGKPTCVNHKKG